MTLEGEVKQPSAFVWRGEEYTVAEVVHAWPDWGFAQGAMQRNWRSRRHRNYFRVRTTSGEVYELYLDRGTKPGHQVWYLYQQLDTGEETAGRPEGG